MFTISLIYSHSSIYDPHIKGLTVGGGSAYICTITLMIYHMFIYIYNYIDDISYVYVYVQLYW